MKTEAATANQLYPPEPPISFPPLRGLEANQLNPPEPPLSFPPTNNKIAEQLYPPEPPLSFPPVQPTVMMPDSLPNQGAEPQAMLISDLMDDMTLEAATATPHDRELRAEAHALTDNERAVLSIGHATPQQAMNMSEVNMAGGLLMVMVAALVVGVARRKGKNKKLPNDQSVIFSDSYEPFLG